MITKSDFLLSEKSSRDTIDVKRIYIDMAGDLAAGVLLSQILFWHLPADNGESRLRVKKEGFYWLAKARHDWWKECRISFKQYKRAIKILEKKSLVKTGVFRFAGTPTTHVRINWEGFLKSYACALENGEGGPKGNYGKDPRGSNPLT